VFASRTVSPAALMRMVVDLCSLLILRLIAFVFPWCFCCWLGHRKDVLHIKYLLWKPPVPRVSPLSTFSNLVFHIFHTLLELTFCSNHITCSFKQYDTIKCHISTVKMHNSTSVISKYWLISRINIISCFPQQLQG